MKLNLNAIDVSNEVTKKDGSNDGIWYFGDKINLNEELIIGFSPTNYHCFIICRRYEFHARFSINPCRVQNSRINNIRAALFFRFKNIPVEKLIVFEAYLQNLKNKRTPSCHIGLLQALKYGLGLSIPHHSLFELSPARFLENLWSHGLVDENGGHYSVEAFMTRPLNLQKVIRDIRILNLRYYWVFILSRFHFYFIDKWNPQKTVRIQP